MPGTDFAQKLYEDKIRRREKEEQDRKAAESKKAAEKALERDRRGAYEQRKQFRKLIGGNAGPSKGGGVMAKVRQMNSYNPEAVATEMMIDLIVAIFQFCFNVPYLRRLLEHAAHHSQELQALYNHAKTIEALRAQGNHAGADEAIKNFKPLRLVYEADDSGNFPDVYPLNSRNEPDFTAEPITNPAQINELTIRANGYSIPPRMDIKGIISDYMLGYKTAIDEHIESVLGSNAISELAKMRIHGVQNQPQSQSENNVDPNAANLMLNRPVPRPVPGH